MLVGAVRAYEGGVALVADAARERLGGFPVVPEAFVPVEVFYPIAGEAQVPLLNSASICCNVRCQMLLLLLLLLAISNVCAK